MAEEIDDLKSFRGKFVEEIKIFQVFTGISLIFKDMCMPYVCRVPVEARRCQDLLELEL